MSEDKHDALWNPREAQADEELRRLQTQLAPFGLRARGRGEWTPRAIAREQRRRWPRFVAAALAASLLLVALNSYRLAWQDGAAWRVHGDAGASGVAQLRSGDWLQTGADQSFDIDVARIGRVTLSPGSRLQLVETRRAHHRVRLDSGHMRARIWAPPGYFGVDSDSAEVVDLGCDFDIWKAGDGSGRVYVRSGWIEYRVARRDVLLPAGYELRFDDSHPAAPLRPDASPEFAAAVLSLQQQLDERHERAALSANAERIANLARQVDVYTLLYLLSQRPALADSALYPRLAQALGVRADDAAHRAAWAQGDIAAINRWWDAYPSQPKRWWSNWPDILR
ncbi:hypothetical protein [Arenimonas sp.]|uniref:hypothetical protein n=1 Tax=Arenimonas sp. TaxID=1872635 RepID=UPI0039E29372